MLCIKGWFSSRLMTRVSIWLSLADSWTLKSKEMGRGLSVLYGFRNARHHLSVLAVVCSGLCSEDYSLDSTCAGGLAVRMG
jgi:hypothetical protein